MKSIMPSKACGTIKIPGSKSITQRMLAAALATQGVTVISNIGWCDDVRASVEVVKKAGRDVLETEDGICIGIKKDETGNLYDFRESALAMRMFTPVIAAMRSEFIITGDMILAKRNGSWFMEELGKAGLSCSPETGLPMIINSKSAKKMICLNGGITSQLVTGFMLAGMFSAKETVICVENRVSRPYIELTMSIIRDFGGFAELMADGCYRVKGKIRFKKRKMNVSGDWSNAAFWMVWAAVCGEVSIQGLSIERGADREICDVLKKAGAEVEITKNEVHVKEGRLKCFDFDASDCPDLVPPLAILAAAAEGISCIAGVKRLKYKESDRRENLKKDLTRLGVDISGEEVLLIKGGVIEGGITLDTHGDHRLAMAYAIAGLISKHGVILKDSQVVNKSYDGFFSDMKILRGAQSEYYG